MSATTLGRGPAVSARTGLNEPVRSASATAAKANARAEPAKANAIATPARKPPMGGPTNWFIVSSTAYRRPFAFDRSSRRTIDGMTDWAAVSNSVSPTPRTKAVTYSSHRLSVSVTIVMAMTRATTVRRIETPIIVRRRSSRSASAPAMSTNTSHGNRLTTATPAMRTGESVRRIASSGKAIQNTPSARFEAADEAQSFQ